jgi:hypothetical protein
VVCERRHLRGDAAQRRFADVDSTDVTPAVTDPCDLRAARDIESVDVVRPLRLWRPIDSFDTALIHQQAGSVPHDTNGGFSSPRVIAAMAALLRRPSCSEPRAHHVRPEPEGVYLYLNTTGSSDCSAQISGPAVDLAVPEPGTLSLLLGASGGGWLADDDDERKKSRLELTRPSLERRPPREIAAGVLFPRCRPAAQAAPLYAVTRCAGEGDSARPDRHLELPRATLRPGRVEAGVPERRARGRDRVFPPFSVRGGRRSMSRSRAARAAA